MLTSAFNATLETFVYCGCQCAEVSWSPVCIHCTCIIASYLAKISSVESQKGIIAVLRCSFENQKDTITIDFVQR